MSKPKVYNIRLDLYDLVDNGYGEPATLDTHGETIGELIENVFFEYIGNNGDDAMYGNGVDNLAELDAATRIKVINLLVKTFNDLVEHGITDTVFLKFNQTVKV